MNDPARKRALRSLPLAKAPDSIWTSIEAVLDAGVEPKRVFRRSVWVGGFATAAALAMGLLTWYAIKGPKTSWEVVRLEGAPSVGTRLFEHGRIEVGEWLQTDASSRARIRVGDIGTIEIAPNTRVRMVASRPGEQRLRLGRGEISASVSAPPRLFFVDTPASTAVDLGCAYTMKADGDGNGLLHVTLGWVSLEWGGRVSLVPAGASCRTRSKIGPGTPYFDDASQALQDALGSFDSGGGGADALVTALAAARVRDTLTLWHLLSRVELAQRQLVFNRIVELVPLPKGVSPERAVQLDPVTLKLWREELAWKW
jgi:ferric-dicitrate binding protein FerR (iron transport regulator)